MEGCLLLLADLVAESHELCVVGFEPLRIARAGDEVRVRDDGTQDIEVRLYARDGCVLQRDTSLSDCIRPVRRCDDDLCNHRIEVGSYDRRRAVDQRCIHPYTIARGEVVRLDLPHA